MLEQIQINALFQKNFRFDGVFLQIAVTQFRNERSNITKKQVSYKYTKENRSILSFIHENEPSKLKDDPKELQTYWNVIKGARIFYTLLGQN